MRRGLPIAAVLLALLLLAPAASAAKRQWTDYERPAEFDQASDAGKPVAPRLQNLGTHVFPITTKVPRAQVFMSQGLNLAWAFNHAEAARSFAAAAAAAGLRRIVYLGGLGDDNDDLSAHLRSRREVEDLLGCTGVPVRACSALARPAATICSLCSTARLSAGTQVASTR